MWLQSYCFSLNGFVLLTDVEKHVLCIHGGPNSHLHPFVVYLLCIYSQHCSSLPPCQFASQILPSSAADILGRLTFEEDAPMENELYI